MSASLATTVAHAAHSAGKPFHFSLCHCVCFCSFFHSLWRHHRSSVFILTAGEESRKNLLMHFLSPIAGRRSQETKITPDVTQVIGGRGKRAFTVTEFTIRRYIPLSFIQAPYIITRIQRLFEYFITFSRRDEEGDKEEEMRKTNCHSDITNRPIVSFPVTDFWLLFCSVFHHHVCLVMELLLPGCCLLRNQGGKHDVCLLFSPWTRRVVTGDVNEGACCARVTKLHIPLPLSFPRRRSSPPPSCAILPRKCLS